MPNAIFKLNKYKLLRSERPVSEVRAYGYEPAKVKLKKRRIRILGDSLSDQGKKYNETIFFIPYSCFLPPSKHGEFTNGFVWVEYFKNALLSKRDQQAKGLRNRYLPSVESNSAKFLINEAEGGATAFKYSGFLNFFRYLKGWFMSFFLGNIQDQATQLKSKKNGLGPDDILIIFAGANDLVTVKYPNPKGAKRAVKGIHNAIKTSVQAGCNTIVLATVPDIGKTPRYQEKPGMTPLQKEKLAKERKAVTEACQILNQGIYDLAANYRYIDPSNCDIYQFTGKNNNKVNQLQESLVLTLEKINLKMGEVIENKKTLSEIDEFVDIEIRSLIRKVVNIRNKKGNTANKIKDEKTASEIRETIENKKSASEIRDEVVNKISKKKENRGNKVEGEKTASQNQIENEIIIKINEKIITIVDKVLSEVREEEDITKIRKIGAECISEIEKLEGIEVKLHSVINRIEGEKNSIKSEIISKIRDKGRDAIIIFGSGHTRVVDFQKKGKDILTGAMVTLSDSQEKLLGNTEGEVTRSTKNSSEQKELVNELTKKAKLVDIKVFDAAAIYDEIYSNPEKYGFTSGCGVYFYNGVESLEKLVLAKKLDLAKIIDGNAVILEEGEAGEYQLHIFKDKELFINKLLTFPVEKQGLEEKLTKATQESLYGLLKLVGCEDTHDDWTTPIVQRAVENYERVFKQNITLANINLTILDAIKENLPDNSRLSWDGLHPDAIVHFIFGAAFEEFFDENYEIVPDRKWMDDTALLAANASSHLNPRLYKYKEAPDLMIEASHLMLRSSISPTSEIPEPVMQDLDSAMDYHSAGSSLSSQNEASPLEQTSTNLNQQVDSSHGLTVIVGEGKEDSQLDSSSLLAKDGRYRGFFVKPPPPPNRSMRQGKQGKHCEKQCEVEEPAIGVR